jgi:hypothetical protein
VGSGEGKPIGSGMICGYAERKESHSFFIASDQHSNMSIERAALGRNLVPNVEKAVLGRNKN